MLRSVSIAIGIAALAMSSASLAEVKSPRDVASGQSSGKRMHKPFVITKDWSSQAQAQTFCDEAKGVLSSSMGKFACTVEEGSPAAVAHAAQMKPGYDLATAKK